MMDTSAGAGTTSWAEWLGGFLNYDFCPWANRWVYWLKKPVASLSVAALLSLCCALFVKPVAVVGFAGVTLTLALGYLWPAVALRRVRAELSFEQTRVREGAPCVAVLRITNGWPWPIFGLALENGFFRSGSHSLPSALSDVALALDSAPGWSTTEFRWEFTPACRGVYPLAPPRLTTGFPFGLKSASCDVEGSARLIVWPQSFPVDTLLDAEMMAWRDDLLSERRVGNCGDLLGTRGFRDGDSLRRVHWAQTARHGRLIVCERQGTTQSSLRIIVDVEPGIHSGDGAEGSLEWSLRIAASLCEAYHAEHADVVCVVGREEHSVREGEVGLRRFLDFLAAWNPPADDVAGQRAAACHAPSRRVSSMELWITTDHGLAKTPQLQHPRGDQRCIVLQRSAFESVTPDVGMPTDTSDLGKPLTLCAAHAWVAIKDRRSVASQFRRQWRKVCSDG